jgi:hypothetical protein
LPKEDAIEVTGNNRDPGKYWTPMLIQPKYECRETYSQGKLMLASRPDRNVGNTLRSATEIDLLKLGTLRHDRSAIVFVFTFPHCGRDFDDGLAAFEDSLFALHLDFVFAGLQLCAADR